MLSCTPRPSSNSPSFQLSTSLGFIPRFCRNRTRKYFLVYLEMKDYRKFRKFRVEISSIVVISPISCLPRPPITSVESQEINIKVGKDVTSEETSSTYRLRGRHVQLKEIGEIFSRFIPIAGTLGRINFNESTMMILRSIAVLSELEIVLSKS